MISKEIRDEKGKLCQDRESNSEWETEEEKEGIEEAMLGNEEEEKHIGTIEAWSRGGLTNKCGIG